jgi:hypothetical protein
MKLRFEIKLSLLIFLLLPFVVVPHLLSGVTYGFKNFEDTNGEGLEAHLIDRWAHEYIQHDNIITPERRPMRLKQQGTHQGVRWTNQKSGTETINTRNKSTVNDITNAHKQTSENPDSVNDYNQLKVAEMGDLERGEKRGAREKQNKWKQIGNYMYGKGKDFYNWGKDLLGSDRKDNKQIIELIEEVAKVPDDPVVSEQVPYVNEFVHPAIKQAPEVLSCDKKGNLEFQYLTLGKVEFILTFNLTAKKCRMFFGSFIGPSAMPLEGNSRFQLSTHIDQCYINTNPEDHYLPAQVVCSFGNGKLRFIMLLIVPANKINVNSEILKILSANNLYEKVIQKGQDISGQGSNTQVNHNRLRKTMLKSKSRFNRHKY